MVNTIIKATQCNPERGEKSSWEVEYAEFTGRYFLSNADYKLQMKVQELINKGINEADIEDLLDLQRDVDNQNGGCPVCD